MQKSNKPSDDDIRTEYTSLSSYVREIVKFRFTLLGLFLATSGFIVGGTNPSKEKFVLLAALSIGLWLLELRNRALLIELDTRAMQIENEYWKYQGAKADEPFFSCQHKEGPRYTRVWKWKVKCPVTHAKALDFIYLVVFLYALVSLYLIFN